MADDSPSGIDTLVRTVTLQFTVLGGRRVCSQRRTRKAEIGRRSS